MKEYWDKAISFDEYVKIGEQRLQNPANEQEKSFAEYYQLGLQRMERFLKVYSTDEEQLADLKSKNFNGKILIISEVWCGDASATVPVIEKFFEGKNEVQIFLRDSDPSLIDQFLTDGSQSIPKVIILDENYNVINSWGPRPKYGHELLLKYKADPENFPKEQFYHDLQIYYSRNKGKDAISELLELL